MSDQVSNIGCPIVDDTVQHVRVREYLRSLYGKEPQPLRSFLNHSEAQFLTNAHAFGRAAFADMDLRGYPGKHRTAVEASIRRGLAPESLEFWQAARLYYLEINGDYKRGLAPPRAE